MGTASTSDLSLEDGVPGGRMRIRYRLQREDSTAHQVFIIDVDCFKEAKIERHEVFGILDRFHEVAGNFFRWAISDATSSALGPLPLDGSD